MLNDFIIGLFGFIRIISDLCIYIKKSKIGELIIIVIFVDDMFVVYYK